MISNERPSPFGRRPYSQPRPQVQEDTLKSDKVQIERKTFLFALKENPRGRFLRITEDVNGRRDNIIIPATGLEEFKRIFDEMVKTANEQPPKPESESDNV
jgi:PurA ssDNA and RNA-binding protein